MIVLVVTGRAIVVELCTETLIFVFVNLYNHDVERMRRVHFRRRFVVVVVVENVRIEWFFVNDLRVGLGLVGVVVLIRTEIFVDEILILVAFVVVTD